MSDAEFTEAEKRYLQDLRKLPSSMRSRVLGWALEILPSMGFFVFGLTTDRKAFLVLGYISLLYFAVWRMYGQLRGSRLIQGICKKQLAEHNQEER